jgi:hypothetical protein
MELIFHIPPFQSWAILSTSAYKAKLRIEYEEEYYEHERPMGHALRYYNLWHN